MPQEALRKILPIAGWPDEPAAVTFTGGTDPVLPTPFRIGVAGAATAAAAGLAAARLWQVRTGRRQQMTVDLRQATASLRSGHYMKLGEGASVAPAQRHHGLLSHARRALELPALQFPQPSRGGTGRAGRGRGSRRGGGRGGQMERRRPRGGDHRRQGRRRHGADASRMEAASAGHRHRRPAADGDRAHRRQPAGGAAARATGRWPASACSTSRACWRARPARAPWPSMAPT